jgi:hypothetical protein
MIRADYKVQFNCPTFLGDAEQQSAWRTPPFKALLQHWWRVAVAKHYDYDWQKIREVEGRLFGHAWLDNGSWAMRSRVRMKLGQHRPGKLDHWSESPPSLKITHPEVKDRNTGKLRAMAPETYMAYGPLHFRDGLTHAPAINATEQNQLTLIYPEEADEALADALQLIHWFGTLGGRSRNAWGSVELSPATVGATPSSRQIPLRGHDVLLNGKADLTRFQKPLKDCLTQEWPHAIGTDEKGALIWKTEACTSWMAVMRKLAEVKIGYRTSLSVTKPFDERQVLALPVTHHTPKELKNDRLAGQMRSKIIQQDGKYIGLVFHLPCKIPPEVAGKLRHPDAQKLIANQESIWRKVHQHLDNHLQRTGSR